MSTAPVEVVCFSLDVEPAPWESWLSDEERRRSQRFVAPSLRSRFIVAHARTREILAHYLAAEPGAIRFEHGREGKPLLVEPHADWRFNLSHGDTRALVAVCWQRDVGVDIERVRPVPDLDSIARQYFAPDEAAYLGRLAPGERDAAFLSLWTRKESYLKAIGTGLKGLTPAMTTSNWRTWDIREIPGHCAAVTAAGDDAIGYRLRWL